MHHDSAGQPCQILSERWVRPLESPREQEPAAEIERQLHRDVGEQGLSMLTLSVGCKPVHHTSELVSVVCIHYEVTGGLTATLPPWATLRF